MSQMESPQGASVRRPGRGGPWTVLDVVLSSAAYLERRGIGEARLDVEHLLAHTLGTSRLGLYLEFDRPLSTQERSAFKPLLLERARGRPLQYILGRASFRELELEVDDRVLIPRSETEELVGAVLARVGDRSSQHLRALDVGTGSGAIGLSLAYEGPFRWVVATDSSARALEVARKNARTHDLDGRLEFRCGRTLEPVRAGERFDVLVSNPPYVTTQDFHGLEVKVRDWEPGEALMAGDDGMEVLDSLVDGAPGVLEVGGLLALEVGAGQASAVASRIRATVGFGSPEVVKDLRQVERIVLSVWHGKGSIPSA